MVFSVPPGPAYSCAYSEVLSVSASSQTLMQDRSGLAGAGHLRGYIPYMFICAVAGLANTPLLSVARSFEGVSCRQLQADLGFPFTCERTWRSHYYTRSIVPCTADRNISRSVLSKAQLCYPRQLCSQDIAQRETRAPWRQGEPWQRNWQSLPHLGRLQVK